MRRSPINDFAESGTGGNGLARRTACFVSPQQLSEPVTEFCQFSFYPFIMGRGVLAGQFIQPFFRLLAGFVHHRHAAFTQSGLRCRKHKSCWGRVVKEA